MFGTSKGRVFLILILTSFIFLCKNFEISVALGLWKQIFEKSHILHTYVGVYQISTMMQWRFFAKIVNS